MEKEEISKKSEEHQIDNLEKIKDIGVAFARALHSIGINKYSQLMVYTPEQLSFELEQQAKVKVSSDRIKLKNWIGQAKELASDDKNVSKTGALEQEKIWKQYAGFSVFFDYKLDEEGKKQWHTLVWKTKAYHDESGETTEFEGIGPTNWVNWILEMADLENEHLQTAPMCIDDASVPPETKAIISSAEHSLLDISINSIAINPTLDSPHDTITADLDVVLSGDKVQDLFNKKIPFQLEVHSKNMETDEHKLEAYERQTRKLDKDHFTTQLVFPIPQEIGRYELQTMVFLLPPYQAYSIKEGYSLNVVP